MRRPSQNRPRRSFDTWQIIYIDLMTNVMIFFVVLWAIQTRQAKGSSASVNLGTETVKMVSLPGDVLFSTGKTELNHEGQVVFEKLFSDPRGAVLNFDSGPLTKRVLVLHGHTDSDGSKEKNFDLGYQRAMSAYREIRKYGSELSDHVVICTHADNTAAQDVPKLTGELSDAEKEAVKAAKAKNRRITIEDKVVSRVKKEKGR
jgi:outer membrane protein OmpA-like peptidoglycan-associated protein